MNPRLLGPFPTQGPHRGLLSTVRNLVLRKTEPLSSLAAPIIILNPLNPSNLHPKKRKKKKSCVCVCVYIYYTHIYTRTHTHIYTHELRKKTYLQSLYTYTHPIFYGTRSATEERGSRLTSLHIKCHNCERRQAYVNQSLVFCYRAQRLVIWLLQ